MSSELNASYGEIDGEMADGRKGTEQEQRSAEEKLRAVVTETLSYFGAGDVQRIVEDQLDREDETDAS